MAKGAEAGSGTEAGSGGAGHASAETVGAGGIAALRKDGETASIPVMVLTGLPQCGQGHDIVCGCGGENAA